MFHLPQFNQISWIIIWALECVCLHVFALLFLLFQQRNLSALFVCIQHIPASWANENIPHERAINTWRINCTEYYWKCKTMNVVFSIEIHKNWIAFRGSEFLALYIYIHNLNAHATQPNREIWQNWTATESSWIFATESTKTWIEMNNSFDSIFSFCWFLLDFLFNQILCTWRGSLHAFDLSNIWEWFCLHSCWCCIARLNYKFCVNNFQNNTDKYILLQKLDGINEITLRIG